MDDAQLWRELGQQFRVDSVRCAAAAKSGHPTSGMSAADLMAVLLAKYLRYDFDDPDAATNDRLVFSKGHASTLLYAMFRAAGAITDEELLDLPPVRLDLEGHPTPLHPVGGRRHGLARPGAADRGRDGDRRQVPRPAPVPRLGALRRQRDRRGVDLGGVRARVALRARQPDRDLRRQPARASAARRWTSGSSTTTAPGPRRSAGTRSRSTATTSEAIDAAYAEAAATTGQAERS